MSGLHAIMIGGAGSRERERRSGIRAIVMGAVVSSGVIGAAGCGKLVGMAVGAKASSDEVGGEDGVTVAISVGLDDE